MGRTACTEPQCLYKGAFYFTLTEGGVVPGCAITGVVYLFKFIDRTDFVSKLTAAAGCFLTNYRFANLY